MENKHTPGPWYVSAFREVLKMPEQIKIANRISGSNIIEAEANAKLFGAAPELLEALQNLIAIARSYEMLPVKWLDPLQAAEDAVKKATL